MNLARKRAATAAIVLIGVVVNATIAVAGPTPIGFSTTTITYNTDAGSVALSGSTDYSGQSPADAAPLSGTGTSNVRTFNSVNAFGRRMVIVNSGLSGDPFDDALRPGESQIAHAFFKLGGNNNADYFPSIQSGSTITVAVEGITFDEPAFIDPSTVMLHALWSSAQVEELDAPYFGLHNHHTLTDPFRNQDAFEHQFINVFNSLGGTPNYALDSSLIDLEIVGNGTTELDLSFTMSYDAFRNFEELGQVVPDGLPAPHGFLEPFHFHLEYVVTPEPGCAILLLIGAGALGWRRRQLNARHK